MIDNRDTLFIGAPGGFAMWTFNVLKAVTAWDNGGPTTITMVERLSDIPPLASDRKRRILLSHYPTRQIVEALQKDQVATFFLSEPSELVVNFLMLATNRDDLAAIRVCTASYIANMALRDSKYATTMHRDTTITLRQYLDILCQIGRLDVPSTKLDAYARGLISKVDAPPTLDALVTAAFPSAPSDLKADSPALTATTASLIDSILRPLMPPGPGPCVIHWPAEAFYIGTSATERARHAIDLTGPARILYHGPYLHLPPATYDATLELAVEDIASDMTFSIGVHAGVDCLAQVCIQPRKPGRYQAPFTFHHTNSDAEVQVQVIAERGSIFGTFELAGIKFAPHF